MKRKKTDQEKATQDGGEVDPQIKIEQTKHQVITAIAAIELAEGEKSQIQESITEDYRDAKDKGLNVKALRQTIRLRKQMRAVREAELSATHDYLETSGS